MSRYAVLGTQASRLRIYNGIYIELDLMPRGGFFNMPKIFAGSILGDTLHCSYEKNKRLPDTHRAAFCHKNNNNIFLYLKQYLSSILTNTFYKYEINWRLFVFREQIFSNNGQIFLQIAYD